MLAHLMETNTTMEGGGARNPSGIEANVLSIVLPPLPTG